MHYIRTGIFSVKTPQGTPLKLLTFSLSYFSSSLNSNRTIGLILDHWACPVINSNPKVGLKKQQVEKKLNETVKNFMVPFYGWGSTASRLESLWGVSLLYNTKFPEISGTHFIDLWRMKGWVDLGATQWFWTRESWIGNPAS